jgi:hypothetical protein
MVRLSYWVYKLIRDVISKSVKKLSNRFLSHALGVGFPFLGVLIVRKEALAKAAALPLPREIELRCHYFIDRRRIFLHDLQHVFSRHCASSML